MIGQFRRWRVALAAVTLSWLSPFSLAADEAPRSPSEMIRPFAQDDLRDFVVWLKNSAHEDPHHVFQMKNGVLRCGDEDMGYVATKVPYRDYHLRVEYRWGRKNPNDKYVRNSGVLLHGVGPDGSHNGVWMTSVECQLAQGCEGDLIVIRGKNEDGQPFPATISSRTVKAADGKTRWARDGQPTPYNGKQFWWSKHQPFFEEFIDTRGKDDVASLLGEWTKVECLCRGSKITIRINGEAVNECYDAHPAGGRILLQAEGHEVFFQNLEIGPLPSESSDNSSK